MAELIRNIYLIRFGGKSPYSLERVAQIAANAGIEGATFLLGKGLWKGKIENSLIAEIVETSKPLNYATIETFAIGVLTWRKEQCALVTVNGINYGFINVED